MTTDQEDPWANEPEPESIFAQPVFVGSRQPPPGGAAVYLNDEPLPPRFEVRNHSPTGFEWGYAGSGPSQLALAMLMAVTDQAEACREYQNFKRACVARITVSAWALPVADVTKWLEQQRNDSASSQPVEVQELWPTPRENQPAGNSGNGSASAGT